MCTRRGTVTSTYLRRGVIFLFTISKVCTIMIHGQFNRAILSRNLRRFTPRSRWCTSRSQPPDESIVILQAPSLGHLSESPIIPRRYTNGINVSRHLFSEWRSDESLYALQIIPNCVLSQTFWKRMARWFINSRNPNLFDDQSTLRHPNCV